MIERLTEKEATRIPDADLYNYFSSYAQYIPDAPEYKYCIRIGMKFLRAADTMELRTAFERHIRKLKRGRRMKL